MSFDKIFDLTAGVYFNFYNILLAFLIIELSNYRYVAISTTRNFILSMYPGIYRNIKLLSNFQKILSKAFCPPVFMLMRNKKHSTLDVSTTPVSNSYRFHCSFGWCYIVPNRYPPPTSNSLFPCSSSNSDSSSSDSSSSDSRNPCGTIKWLRVFHLQVQNPAKNKQYDSLGFCSTFRECSTTSTRTKTKTTTTTTTTTLTRVNNNTSYLLTCHCTSSLGARPRASRSSSTTPPAAPGTHPSRPLLPEPLLRWQRPLEAGGGGLCGRFPASKGGCRDWNTCSRSSRSPTDPPGEREKRQGYPPRRVGSGGGRAE